MTELIRRDLLKVLADLPPICAARLPNDNSPILLKRGIVGYWPRPQSFDVDAFNKRHGITPGQVEAMLAGSIFGFECPAADPLNYDSEGRPDDPSHPRDITRSL